LWNSVNNTLAYLSKIAKFLSISTSGFSAKSKVAALLQQRWDCAHEARTHQYAHSRAAANRKGNAVERGSTAIVEKIEKKVVTREHNRHEQLVVVRT
jgi:hypothetical protein